MKILISENHKILFESQSVTREFLSLIQDWQSEHSYRGVDVDEITRLFHLLPDKLKSAILVTDISNLASAITQDNIEDINAPIKISSFTNPDNAQWYQDIRGHDLLIKGTDVKNFDFAISLPKLSNLYSSIADDEDEILVFGAIIDQSAIDRNNEDSEKEYERFHTFLSAGYDVIDDYRTMVTNSYYHDIQIQKGNSDDDKLQMALIINFVKDTLLTDDNQRYITSPKYINQFTTPQEYKTSIVSYLNEKNKKLSEQINYISQFMTKMSNTSVYDGFKTKTLNGISNFDKKYQIK